MPFIYELIFLWDFHGVHHPDSLSLTMPRKQRIPSFLEVFTTIQRTTENIMLMPLLLFIGDNSTY